MEMASQMSDMSKNIEKLMSRFGNQPLVADQVYVRENRGMDMNSMVVYFAVVLIGVLEVDTSCYYCCSVEVTGDSNNGCSRNSD